METARHRLSLVVFHRDLRVEDNTALIAALETSSTVVPCVFVEDAMGLRSGDGGPHAAKFTLEALVDLDARLREEGSFLHVFRGTVSDLVSRLVEEHGVDAVFFNKEYTPAAMTWQVSLEETCGEYGVVVSAWDDGLIHEPGRIVKTDGTPYTVFSPYHRRAIERPVREPRSHTYDRLGTIDGAISIDVVRSWWGVKEAGRDAHRGGRTAALQILRSLNRFSDYKTERDFPEKTGTTSLSPYLRSGCCSVREVIRAIRDGLGEGHELIRQLHWRDFFTHIAFFFPHVFDGPFHHRYGALEWDDDRARFDAWCQGKTGFPIVDAGLRELEATGEMHNRVRMIVASFLVKDLHIDWRKGERHFAERLVDYDPALNNGNWQWAASTGCDAQPFFRIFNPWLQQKKFDPDAVYIKRWVAELAPLAPREIHELWKRQPAARTEYPRPMVDHTREAGIARDRYRACAR